jgi:hypothetical protein
LRVFSLYLADPDYLHIIDFYLTRLGLYSMKGIIYQIVVEPTLRLKGRCILCSSLRDDNMEILNFRWN